MTLLAVGGHLKAGRPKSSEMAAHSQPDLSLEGSWEKRHDQQEAHLPFEEAVQAPIANQEKRSGIHDWGGSEFRWESTFSKSS
jgi:hypothetical protein